MESDAPVGSGIAGLLLMSAIPPSEPAGEAKGAVAGGELPPPLSGGGAAAPGEGLEGVKRRAWGRDGRKSPPSSPAVGGGAGDGGSTVRWARSRTSQESSVSLARAK